MNRVIQSRCHSEGCPVCGHKDEVSERFKKWGYSILRCSGCSLMFVYPQPSKSELLELYSGDYFLRGGKYAAVGEGGGENPSRQNDLAKLEVVGWYKSKGRLLDVGCAFGEFMKLAQEKGYDVSGVETSEAAAGYAKETLGLEVFNCELQSADLGSQEYDLITMWDVLEHVGNPVATLSEVSRLLRPGGTVIISTGDSSSKWARLTGGYWHLLTPPQHLFFFNPVSLTKVLEMNGLFKREIVYMGKKAALNFILFKARESFGPIVWPLALLAKVTGLERHQIIVNLRDIMTCVAEKPL